MRPTTSSLWFEERPAHLVSFWALLALVIISLYSAAVASALSFFGVIDITPTLFFGVLSIQALLAGLLGVMVYVYRTYLTVVAKAMALNTVAIIVWWGLIHSILVFFAINLNSAQEDVITRFWMWELPVVLIFVEALTFFIARPLLRTENPEALSALTFRFPKIFTYIAIGLIVIGHSAGVLWLTASFALPLVELSKLIALGGVSTLVVGAFVLSISESLMQSVRQSLALEYQAQTQPKRKLARRILGSGLMVGVAVMVFLGVAVLQSYQHITIEGVQRLLHQAVGQSISSRANVTRTLGSQMNSQLSISPKTVIDVVAPGEQYTAPVVSDEVRKHIALSDSGVAVDYHQEIDVIQFFIDPVTQQKVVVQVPLLDFYEPIARVMRKYLIATAIGIGALMTIVLFLASYLSSRLQDLSRAVRQARNARETFTFNTHSADELEDLSLSFQYYINKSNELRSNLEEKVQQRTEALLEAEQEARDAEMAVVQQNTQFEQQKRRVAEESADQLETVVEERTAALQDALEHLQELDQVKTEFISLASHQLRTPLTSLRWAQHALLEGSAGELTKPQREIVATTLDRIVYMMTLVNELLDVTRIEDQNYELKVEKTDMYATLTRIAGQFKDAAVRKNITFTVDIADSLPEAMVDGDKIEMAVANLLDNAVKYTNPKGKVTLHAAKDDNAVRIQVSDTGIGISEKDQYRMFSKFFRAGNAIAMHTVGSGLGMYIAKTIAEKHGGTIDIESKEGKGSTFTLTIPIERGPEKESDQVEATKLKKMKKLGAITSLVTNEDE